MLKNLHSTLGVSGACLMIRPSIISPPFSVGCVFQLQKFNADGVITYLGPRFHNLVLDAGLDLMVNYGPHGQSNGVLNYCNVGTGAGFESVEETGLVNFVASTSAVIDTETYYSSGVGYDYPAWRSWRQVFEFSIGSVGHTVSEIGLSRESNSDYFNRHRIVDPLGHYIGLNILPDEGLRVWTESYLFGSVDIGYEGDISFTFESTSGPVDIEGIWTQFGGWLTESGIVPGNISTSDIRILKSSSTDPSAGTAASSISAPYESGDFKRDVEAKWDAGVLSGDYYSLLVNMTGATYGRFDFDTPITMDHEGTALKITVRRAWGRTLEEGTWI